MEGVARIVGSRLLLIDDVLREFTMKYDPQTLQAARCLFDLYGSDAANVAEKRAALSGKHLYGSSAPTWRRIARAIRDIQAHTAGGICRGASS
jgi:hypothetical protein